MTDTAPNPFINPEKVQHPYQLPALPFASMGDAGALSLAREASGALIELGFLGSDDLVEGVAGQLYARELVAALRTIRDQRADLQLPVPEGPVDELTPREIIIGLAALYAWEDK